MHAFTKHSYEIRRMKIALHTFVNLYLALGGVNVDIEVKDQKQHISNASFGGGRKNELDIKNKQRTVTRRGREEENR